MEHSNSIWDPELLLAGWMAASFMLMTVSLLFYHMTKLSSLEMQSNIAGLFAVSLIFISAALCISGLTIYSKRIKKALKIRKNNKSYRDTTNIDRENDYRILYIVLGSLLTVIEIGICLVILKGVVTKF